MKKNYNCVFEREGSFDGKTGMIENEDNSIIIIWTEKKPDNPKGISILVHELFHAVGMCFKKVDVKYSQENDEPFAYLLGRLTEEALK